MKTRKFIATMLGLGVLGCIVFGLAALAMYCDQVFLTAGIPAICREDSLTMPLVNTFGWILLFVIPISVWFLYARLGWPRGGSSSDKTSRRK